MSSGGITLLVSSASLGELLDSGDGGRSLAVFIGAGTPIVSDANNA